MHGAALAGQKRLGSPTYQRLSSVLALQSLAAIVVAGPKNLNNNINSVVRLVAAIMAIAKGQGSA
jgi:hypothetical protein